MGKQNGIYYGWRRLADGRFGILVAVWIKGEWIETDMNTTPWPTPAVALDRAKRSAEAYRDNTEPGLPVVAMEAA